MKRFHDHDNSDQFVMFVLYEYQKTNSSTLPVIFISFKTINEQRNFRRQQLTRGTEN